MDAFALSTRNLGAQAKQNWASLIEVAALEVFEMMLGGGASKSAGSLEMNGMQITAMVGLAGVLQGVMSVHCNRAAAALIAERMLGAPTTAQDEIADALGEICNMITGNFKNKVSELANGCMLSPPTVVSGEDYETHSLARDECVQIALDFMNLPVIIMLEMHK